MYREQGESGEYMEHRGVWSQWGPGESGGMLISCQGEGLKDLLLQVAILFNWCIFVIIEEYADNDNTFKHHDTTMVAAR